MLCALWKPLARDISGHYADRACGGRLHVEYGFRDKCILAASGIAAATTTFQYIFVLSFSSLRNTIPAFWMPNNSPLSFALFLPVQTFTFHACKRLSPACCTRNNLSPTRKSRTRFKTAVAKQYKHTNTSTMQNDQGQIMDLYIPRKCSWTNKILASNDYGSVQFNVGHVDPKTGIYTGTFTPICLSGKVRQNGEADLAVNELVAKMPNKWPLPQ